MTTLPAPGDPKTLYVVDISGYIFRAYYALPALSNSRGEPTHAVHGVTAMLLKLIAECRPALFAVAMDSPQPSFRHELSADYKANRTAHPEDLPAQIRRVQQIVEAYAIPAFGEPGLEADDLIATVVRAARAQGLRVVIVSADKDLLQLVGPDVVMYDTMRERVFGAEETEARMGVPPAQVRDLLALMGDSSDNVPGVPGVGPKTATSLLRDYGDLDGIYAHLDDIARKSLREKLASHKKDAYLSRELVTLRDDADVEFDLDALRYGGADETRLRELFVELEFRRLLSQLPEVARPAHEEAVSPTRIGSRQGLEEVVRSIRTVGSFAAVWSLAGDNPLYDAPTALGLSWAPGRCAWVPAGKGGLGEPDMSGGLADLLGDSSLLKFTSNLKDDQLVCERLEWPLQGPWFDTMLASYLLDPESRSHDLDSLARSLLRSEPPPGVAPLGESAALASERLLRVGLALQPRLAEEGLASLLEDVEQPLARVLATMEQHGIRLDVAHLRKIERDVETRLTALEARCIELAGRPFNLASPRQLEVILFDELGLPSSKRTKTARSTSQDVLEDLALVHELPAAILEHRALAKLKNTYLDALPRQVDPRTGRIHTRYNQAVAATGRLSSSDPNLQNIPIRSEVGRGIRQAFVPEEGWRILAADYSQIELRILAHLSQDPELRQALAANGDVHTRTATALFSVDEANVTKEMRARAKTVNFAVIYGQTQFALARNLRIDRHEAKRYIDAFFERYAGVKRYFDDVVEQARETGEVRTLLGRRRRLADLRSRNAHLRAAAERMARNTPIQGSAADVMKVAMVAIDRELRQRVSKTRMLLTVHDELVFEVPPSEEAAMWPLVQAQMETAVPLSVPLVVDLGWGANWGQAH